MAKKKTPGSSRTKPAAAKKPPEKLVAAKEPVSAAPAKTAPAASPATTPASVAVAVAAPTVDQLPAVPAADFVFKLRRDSEHRGLASPGVALEIVDHAEGVSIARISGGDSAASSGARPGGWSIQVPDKFEAAASGKAVKISVCARAANGAASAEFACAYSTNEVGNSGWRRFTTGSTWQLFAFSYDVNPMVKGRGDFIGILPAPAGAPGVEIGFIAAQVTERLA